MQVKTYHTMDVEEWKKFIDYFHPNYGSHYICLPSGRILVSVFFAAEWSEAHFGSKTTTRHQLHHPVFNGNKVICQSHQDELRCLFEEKPDDVKTATVGDVIRKACAIHPLMRLSVF